MLYSIFVIAEPIHVSSSDLSFKSMIGSGIFDCKSFFVIY